MPPKKRVPPTRTPGITYQHLDQSAQTELLSQRLRQLEAEHYNHSTNRLVIESLPDSEERDVALLNTDAALKALESAHSVIAAELAAQGGT